MPVLDLYSCRKRVAAGDTPDVFVYDELPQKLLIQIVRIWRQAIGPFYESSNIDFSPVPNNNEAWWAIHELVAQERGVFQLAHNRALDRRCETFLFDPPSVDEALDLIEVSFGYIDKVLRDLRPIDREGFGIEMTVAYAIAELNVRFQRAGAGYQFDDGRIFRVDSELIHREVVRPGPRIRSAVPPLRPLCEAHRIPGAAGIQIRGALRESR